MTTLAEEYLKGRGGSPTEFTYNLSMGQRLGQAFFNALSGVDQDRIRGTRKDPFYFHTEHKVWAAIEWLLDTEDEKDKLYLRPYYAGLKREGES